MDNKKKSDEDLLKEIEAGERRLLGGIYDDLYGTPQNASPEDALKNANDALREARELLSQLPEDMPKKRKKPARRKSDRRRQRSRKNRRSRRKIHLSSWTS